MNKRQLDNLQKAKKYARGRNGECLSNEYKNIQSRLEWKCQSKNHPEWQESYYNIVLCESWCKICSK